MQEDRIIQIMPAGVDWRAIFADESEAGVVLESPLLGWALVERTDGTRAVVGLTATTAVEISEALENFLGYAPPGDVASRWHQDAVRFLRAGREGQERAGRPA